MSRAARTEGGFTLVELLVTVVVAFMVTMSTFMFFAGQKTVYETQTKLLNVQQNLWAAMETVTRNIRAAGTGMTGCIRSDSDGAIGPDTGDPGPWSATPPQTGLRIWVRSARTAFFPADSPARLAPLWIQNGGGGAASDPDAIWVAYGVGASGNYTDVNLSTATSPSNMNSAVRTANPVAGFPSPTAAFRAGEFFLLVHDTTNPPSLNMDRGCTMMQVTGITALSHTLLHATGTSDWNNGGTSTVNFTWGNPAAAGAYNEANSGIRNFGQLRWIRFAIDATGATPNLTMQRLDQTTTGAPGAAVSAPQVLAEGIEDLQVAYGCDTTSVIGTPDGVISDGTPTLATDEWIGNSAADVPPLNCRRPQAIRVTIIARSASQDTTLSDLAASGINRKPVAENGIQGAPDMFRHRLMQTTVFPRN